MAEYYDGTQILSMRDLNGNVPEIYIVTTNRTGGKTCWFGRYYINRFLKYNEKFALLYRFNYELDDCADKFFKDINKLFFPNYTMMNQRKASGIYHELYLNEKLCGYAISINSADTLKKYAHLFSDVQRILFDEFQSETNHYCSEEMRKFISIHTSIARGNGKQVRYVPVHMLGNPVTILNPYYIELGITSRLRDNTHFLKGDGFVLEQGFNESASKAQKESAFNRAFAKNQYVIYSSESVYLNDNKAFVEKPTGSSTYIATIKFENSLYGVREYINEGIIYVDDKADATFKTKLTVTTEDHQINYVMLKKNDFFLGVLRQYFEQGCFRFKDLRCKEAMLKVLSY